MGIALGILILLIVLMTHEAGHAWAMLSLGVDLEEVGLGIPIGKFRGISFRFIKKIPRISINPLMLGAFVEPSFGGAEKNGTHVIS